VRLPHYQPEIAYDQEVITDTLLQKEGNSAVTGGQRQTEGLTHVANVSVAHEIPVYADNDQVKQDVGLQGRLSSCTRKVSRCGEIKKIPV
jgi:hypothetical protein